jgi:tRNA dimethylallyltransferase
MSPERVPRNTPLPRVLCIVGPTGAGKTRLGISLAKKIQGEIINADARQIYRGFDIGTGKPLHGRRVRLHGDTILLVEGVPHYLMDFLPPTKTFTVAEWKRRALTIIKKIIDRGKVPIIVGGTGLYVQALIDHYRIPAVPPNPNYRTAMEEKTLEELVQMLKQMDPEAARRIDTKNRRRVMRALEVITFSGKPFSEQRIKTSPLVDALLLAPFRTREELHELINRSVDNMMKEGWLGEVCKLAAAGIPWDAPAMTSIGYKELGAISRGEEVDLAQTVEQIKRATRQYAKRQMTWFKRDARIHWVKTVHEAESIVKKWLKE